jgi:hypothetical protein
MELSIMKPVIVFAMIVLYHMICTGVFQVIRARIRVKITDRAETEVYVMYNSMRGGKQQDANVIARIQIHASNTLPKIVVTMVLTLVRSRITHVIGIKKQTNAH